MLNTDETTNLNVNESESKIKMKSEDSESKSEIKSDDIESKSEIKSDYSESEIKSDDSESKPNQIIQKTKIQNRGTGAGGANTNKSGKLFEEKTCIQTLLFIDGYIKYKMKTNKYGYYLRKTFENKTITYVLQDGFKPYVKYKYNIDSIRKPDEAYIIEYNNGKKVIKILEKKVQNSNGSVDLKLWCCTDLKREFEIVFGQNFEFQFAFCLSDYFKRAFSNEKKFKILNVILKESNVPVFFGDDDNYFETVTEWINN